MIFATYILVALFVKRFDFFFNCLSSFVIHLTTEYQKILTHLNFTTR